MQEAAWVEVLPSPAPGEAVSSESAVCEQDGPGALLGAGRGALVEGTVHGTVE